MTAWACSMCHIPPHGIMEGRCRFGKGEGVPCDEGALAALREARDALAVLDKAFWTAVRAMLDTGCTAQEAADALGIGRMTVYRHLRGYGLERGRRSTRKD
jgi:DNA-binding NtrC family response regulator